TTPTLSEALAVTLVVPPTVAPETGEVMLTVGGVVSLNTVTVSAAEVVRLPAASGATAVSVCGPLLAVVVFQETEYGAAASSTPRLAPSSRNCTPTTPTLSEALAVTLVVPPTVAPETGEVMLTVGGVVSLNTVTVTAEQASGLQAASRASVVSVCAPWLAVALPPRRSSGRAASSTPRLAPSSRNCTPTTPTLSEALAVTLVVPPTVAPETGEVMLTVGGVVSLNTVT